MRWSLFAPLALAFVPALAAAQTGVADDRVSLPEGPGSLQGVGDNAQVNPNMGSMSYTVAIDVPDGFAGITPSLSLNYNSAGGPGIAGIGWDMPVPFIERMTNWGLPDYTPDDNFVADGGTQLVRTAEGDPAEYRARIEGGFVRYRWYGVGDGTGGYWTAEQPDGVVRYFGADADGRLDASATMPGPNGASFRYQLVDAVDRFGHRTHYEYDVEDGYPYLSRVTYVFTNGAPKAEVRFGYEARDDQLTDARSGSVELRARRLSTVDVYSNGTRIWRYVVTYEPYAQAGGLSRITRVQRLGIHDVQYPLVLDFQYSKTLGDVCDQDCQQPYLVHMGNLGVNLQAGTSTLIDINGDSLPDVVDASRQGPHRFFINHFTDKTHHTFDAPRNSAVGTQASHQLGSPFVQVLDANGDGRTDMINVRTGDVLFNLGSGDWANDAAVGNVQALPDFTDGFGSGGEDDDRIRFLDYDNDRKIDVIRSTHDQTYIYKNSGAAGFTAVSGVDAIGAAFVDERLDLADMNGDGLQDPVLIEPGQLSYRLNLGHGHWSGWKHIPNLPFDDSLVDDVELEDLNGDSLSDVVIVLPSEVRYVLNRGADRFDAAQSIMAAGGEAVPTRDATTTVLFADMNGSGSDDVVWITANGDVTYLDLFPLRPNLLTKVTNGLGLVTDVTYATSVEQEAADPDGWTFKLPFALQMVRTIDTYDSLNAIHQRATYTYHDAYYDGEEKAWRGFDHVEIQTEGDETQQSGLTVQDYDVGAQDRYRAGKLLDSQAYALEGDQKVPLQTQTFTWEDCPLDGIPDADQLSYPIRFVCQTAAEAVQQEGADPSQWVTTRTETTYDGYGNVAETASLGVVRTGAGSCGACQHDAGLFGAPCGPQCTGDEAYTWNTYVTPDHADGRWIINKLATTRKAAEANAADYAETRYYYDGDAFTGLPLGNLTAGLPSRVEIRTDADHYITEARYAYDQDGNQIESLDPRGTPDGYGFKVHDTYDADHLLVTRTEHDMVDADGNPYVLRQDYEYDPLWGEVSAFSNWVTVVNGQEVTPKSWTRMTYDDLGLRTERLEPGDAPDKPTTSFEYHYSDPVSRVVTRQRSEAGMDQPDRQLSDCIDGFGRKVMTYSQVSPGHFEADSYHVYNKLGQVAELIRSFTSDSDECARSTPQIAPLATKYDALGREMSTTHPDAEVFGTASTTRVERAPLTESRYDAEDTDPQSSFANTPLIKKYDGLGRVVSEEYVVAAGQPGLKYTFEYDQRGALVAVTDPAGNKRLDKRDAAGRVLEVDDPDRGPTLFEYDDAGNQVRRQDAAGHTVRTTYDANDRPVESWDESDREHTLIRLYYDLPSACPDNLCPNGGGQKVGMTYPLGDGRGEEWYTHDARAQIVAMRKIVDGVPFEFRIERNNLGREKSVTLPDGTRLDLTMDGVGRTTAIAGFVDLAKYDRGSLITELRLHDGTDAQWTYDALDRVATHTITGPDGPIVDLTYTHSRKGLMMAIDDASGASPSLSRQFSYDGMDRLVQAVLDPDGPNPETIDYAYDDAANLVRKVSSLGAASPSHVGDLVYGQGAGPHAVTKAGDVAYAYDAAGFVTQRGDVDYDWNWQGQLAAARKGDETIARFMYGYDNDRVVVEEGDHFHYYLDPTFEIDDGMAIVNVRLGEVEVATKESDGLAARILSDLAPADGDGMLTPQPDGRIDAGDAVVAARVQAGDASLASGTPSPVARLLLASARRTLLDGSPRVMYEHHDFYENVVAETAADGRVIEHRSYDPNGLERTTSAETNRGFNDKPTDASTGLVFFGARYYDPRVSRWTAPDPAFDRLDDKIVVNRPMEATGAYLYGLDNPVYFKDAEGGITFEDLPKFDARHFLNPNLTPEHLQEFVEKSDLNSVIDKVQNGINDLSEVADKIDSEVEIAENKRFENIEAAKEIIRENRPDFQDSIPLAKDVLAKSNGPSKETLENIQLSQDLRRDVATLKRNLNNLHAIRNALAEVKASKGHNPLDVLEHNENIAKGRNRSGAMQQKKQQNKVRKPSFEEHGDNVTIRITTNKSEK